MPEFVATTEVPCKTCGGPTFAPYVDTDGTEHDGYYCNADGHLTYPRATTKHPTSATPTEFTKATLEDPAGERTLPGYGGLKAPAARTTVVVGTAEYDHLIAAGWTVVETWLVWTCTTCGMRDSDSPHAYYPGTSHREMYGHDSTRTEL